MICKFCDTDDQKKSIHGGYATLYPYKVAGEVIELCEHCAHVLHEILNNIQKFCLIK